MQEEREEEQPLHIRAHISGQSVSRACLSRPEQRGAFLSTASWPRKRSLMQCPRAGGSPIRRHPSLSANSSRWSSDVVSSPIFEALQQEYLPFTASFSRHGAALQNLFTHYSDSTHPRRLLGLRLTSSRLVNSVFLALPPRLAFPVMCSQSLTRTPRVPSERNSTYLLRYGPTPPRGALLEKSF